MTIPNDSNAPNASNVPNTSKVSHTKLDSDISIIGGGPAGAIASILLARAGFKVTLIEKHSANRDKICGDVLIADSLDLLENLDLLKSFAKNIKPNRAVILYGPNENLKVQTRFSTCSRAVLDQGLRDKALELGAEILYETEAIGCEYHQNHITLNLNSKTQANNRLFSSKLIILATGANASSLKKFQIKHRSAPSAIACRSYFLKEKMPTDEPLHVFWEKMLSPGYGWIFPMNDNHYNVGVGILTEYYKENININRLFEKFITENATVRDLLKDTQRLTAIKGAPLRCGLTGAAPSKDRILLAGEALGTTYHLIGEGVGKAMETGALAANIAIEALTTSNFSAAFLKSYDQKLKNLHQKRFNQYGSLQKLSKYSWMIDRFMKKANQHADIQKGVADILNEKIMPYDLFAITGFFRMLF